MLTFYLVCFLAGLMLSAVALLGGMGHFGGHVGGHVHVPHVPHVPHAGHLVHGAAGAARVAGPGAGPAVGRAAGTSSGTVPWWNGFSIMIFLCWFGAAGYLLTRWGSFAGSVVLVLAGICGLVGGTILFLFLTRFLMPHEHELTADETDVIGAVGRVSSAIRPGGTGEIVYEQLGARRSAPARAEDGGEVERDEEVFVVRYEKGIAYVRKWEEMQGLRDRGA